MFPVGAPAQAHYDLAEDFRTFWWRPLDVTGATATLVTHGTAAVVRTDALPYRRLKMTGFASQLWDGESIITSLTKFNPLAQELRLVQGVYFDKEHATRVAVVTGQGTTIGFGVGHLVGVDGTLLGDTNLGVFYDGFMVLCSVGPDGRFTITQLMSSNPAAGPTVVNFDNPLVLDSDITGFWTTLRIDYVRSEEHTSELQSHSDIVCRL